MRSNVHRLLLLLLAASGLAAAGAPAARSVTLYDNGPVSDGDPQGHCDSGPAAFSCGGSGSWTFYDDFRLTTDALVTGFDYVDYFFAGGPADYVETAFGIFAGDPFASAPIASGTSVALLTATGAPDEYRFEVVGLGIPLAAGDYWLGISNTLTGSGITTAARVANPGGGLDASKASDGATDLDFPMLENRAFGIQGTPVPEPSTGVLTGLGLAALASRRRPLR